MKTTLSCDHVFDVLTRGPFPSGAADDEGVERHLSACHECRRLAEALQPAVALFHETISADHGHGLPEYRGRWSTTPQHPRLRRAADALHREKVAPPAAVRSGQEDSNLTNLVRIASGLMLAASLLLLVWTAGSIVGKGGIGRKPPLAFGPTEPRLGGRTYLALAALNVPHRCMPWGSLLVAEDAVPSKHAVNCCTQCHAAAHPRQDVCRQVWSDGCMQCHERGEPTLPATKAVRIVQKACEVCHDG